MQGWRDRYIIMYITLYILLCIDIYHAYMYHAYIDTYEAYIDMHYAYTEKCISCIVYIDINHHYKDRYTPCIHRYTPCINK